MGNNQEVLEVMNILDELETRKNCEEEIESVSKTIANLDVNEIIKAQLARKLRVLQKRIERAITTDFGAYLRYLREKNGYSLKNIEQEVGISTSYLNRLEMGKRVNPSYTLIVKLAEVLQVPLTQMLTIATSSDEDAMDIIELLLAKPFTIKGHLFEETEKKLVVEIFKQLISCDWSNETIFHDSIELMEKVDIFKQMMIHLETAGEKSAAI
ncbi:helix-turn-helix domain-containing protein [Desulfosporosinus burensis]